MSTLQILLIVAGLIVAAQGLFGLTLILWGVAAYDNRRKARES